MTVDTSGFYKPDGADGLLYGYEGVAAPSFTLTRPLRDTYTYPVDGWRWFDSTASARTFYGLPDPPADDTPTLLTQAAQVVVANRALVTATKPATAAGLSAAYDQAVRLARANNMILRALIGRLNPTGT